MAEENTYAQGKHKLYTDPGVDPVTLLWDHCIITVAKYN